MKIQVQYSDHTPAIFDNMDECVNNDRYNDITILYCANNNLDELPPLPPKLQILDCPHNNLTTLPYLPDSLIYIYACHNNLTTLPDHLPHSIIELFVEHNNITHFPPGIVNMSTQVHFYYVGNNINIDNHDTNIRTWLMENKKIMDERNAYKPTAGIAISYTNLV